MKTKALALIIMLAAGSAASAQYYNEYYHRTGDTVMYQADNGYYMWWGMEDLIRDNHRVDIAYHESWRGVWMAPYYTPTPIKILGIAGIPIGAWHDMYDTMNTLCPEYYYLYDHDAELSAKPVFKKNVQLDLRNSHRYLAFHNSYVYESPITDSCCSFLVTSNHRRLYEFYFDTAVVVTDTFYIGWSYHTQSGVEGNEDVIQAIVSSWRVRTPCGPEDTAFTEQRDPNGVWYAPAIGNNTCYFPVFDYFVCEDTTIFSNPASPNLDWTHIRQRAFYMVYPIIEVDTTLPPTRLCDPVQNLQAVTDGDSCAIFTWDDFLHYTYCELEYYALMDGYVSHQTETVFGNNMLRVCGLDPEKTYRVRARAFCDTSKIETEWSPWVMFDLHNDNGIEASDTYLSRCTYLSPNPAEGSVTVASSFGLTMVEVYNMRGVLVYSEPAGFSTPAVIDLKGWPAGQYIVVVHTPQGRTAKSLTVVK